MSKPRKADGMTGWMRLLAADGGGGFDPTFLVGMVLMMLVFFWVLNGPRRKEEKRRKEMISNLKRNDRVVTRGGILGTVVGLKDNEITLKVDESNNTKMTLLRSAVEQVMGEDEKKKA